MCEHKRIRSVNCVLSCMDCGEILPADFLKKESNKPVEKPVKQPRKRTTKGEK